MFTCPTTAVLSGETGSLGDLEQRTEETVVKKWTLMGALALGIVAVSGQQASAWYKVGFSAGISFTWESANNSWLWGALRSGQVPGHPTDLPTWVSHYPASNSAIAGGVPGGGFG